MLNPLWLKTFRTLIEMGHFTQTAEKLFMTQPGVSQHIKKLEEACGHALISRDKKSFEITEQGSVVYEYAKQLEQREAELLNSLSEDSAHEGEVTISCSGEMALLLYPELLSLQCQYPELVPRMEAAPNKKILADLIECNSDLGLVTHMPADPRIEAKKIGYEPLCLMYPRKLSHQPLSKEILYSLGVITHPNSEHYLSLYFSQCGKDTLADVAIESIPISGYVNQLSQILLPVAKGLGFTVLPLSALSSFAFKDEIAVYQPVKEVVEDIYLASKKRRTWPARFYTIAEKIEQVLTESARG